MGCGARYAQYHATSTRVKKSLLNGKSSPENKCNSLTPDKQLRVAEGLSVRLKNCKYRQIVSNVAWRQGKAENVPALQVVCYTAVPHERCVTTLKTAVQQTTLQAERSVYFQYFLKEDNTKKSTTKNKRNGPLERTV